MKKHSSLLFGALLISGVALAQHAGPASAQKHKVAPGHPVPHPAQQRADAFWTDDFSVPSHWTMGHFGSTTGNWVIGTAAPSGTFAEDAIASTTAGNGFALYDSDALCLSADSAYIATAAPIDLSTHPGATLQFEEYFRQYEGFCFVQVSLDGTNWTTFRVNAQVLHNDETDNPTLVSLPLGGLIGGQPAVWLRFVYGGACDYWWMIDDVALVDQPETDMSSTLAETTMYDYVNTTTYDSLPYSVFPVSELRPLGLNMTFVNNGYEAATNVVAHITTSDGYDQQQTYASVAPMEQTQFVAPAYTPTSSLGNHSIYYNVSSDGTDGIPNDNSDTVKIQVSPYEFARDAGSLEFVYNNQSGDGDAFVIVNLFHVVSDETLYGIDVAFPNTSDPATVNALLMNGGDLSPIAETLEHDLVTSDFNGAGGNHFVSFIFEDPQPLTAGTDYAIGLQHFGGPNVLVGASGDSPAGTTLMMDDPGGDNLIQVPHTAMIRMNFSSTIGIAENDLHNGIGLGQNYPNPANTSTTRIDFSLQQSAPVTLQLRDVNGKLVRTLVQGGQAAGVHHVDVSTADLQAGVYFYTLTTNSSVSTKRMTVVR